MRRLAEKTCRLPSKPRADATIFNRQNVDDTRIVETEARGKSVGTHNETTWLRLFTRRYEKTNIEKDTTVATQR